MAKATLTRLVRKFDAEQEVPTRRAVPMPAQEREERLCGKCQKPMLVSAGQLAHFHKACRKNARVILKRQQKQ